MQKIVLFLLNEFPEMKISKLTFIPFSKNLNIFLLKILFGINDLKINLIVLNNQQTN